MKLLKTLLVVVGVVVLLAISILDLRPKAPKLIEPIPKTIPNLADPNAPLTLMFDRAVALNDFSFTLKPAEEIMPEATDQTTIVINFKKPRAINLKYLLTANYKNSPLFELTFTTNVSQNTQYDARFNQEIQKELDQDYPLITQTPHNTPLYRVVYSAPMTLEITIKNPSIGSTEAIADAKEWVRSLGGDVEAHKYVIAPPSPAP